MLIRRVSHSTIILGSIVGVCALALIGTDTITRGAIAEAQEAHEARLLSEVFPLRRSDRVHAIDDTTYIVCTENHYTGQIDKVIARNGYAGPITLLVGYSTAGNIAAARVLVHRETPGIGDKFEKKKSDWIDQFEGTSLNAPAKWGLRRDGGAFDQMTAATVSSRAVVERLREYLNEAVERSPHECP